MLFVCLVYSVKSIVAAICFDCEPPGSVVLRALCCTVLVIGEPCVSVVVLE